MKLVNRFLVRIDSNIDTKVNLICFPYAGGDVSTFAGWERLFRNDVAIYAVQLAGRGLRASESLAKELRAVTKKVYQEISSSLNGDVVLYGHSNGAIMALSLACFYHSCHDQSLKHLIVSGRNFPSKPEYYGGITDNSTADEVKSLLSEYGATPRELLNSPEFLSYYLPIFQSDILLTKNYLYPLSSPLNFPCSFINLEYDNLVNKKNIFKWKSVSGYFKIFDVDGDHFTINSHPQRITEVIESIVIEYLLVQNLLSI